MSCQNYKVIVKFRNETIAQAAGLEYQRVSAQKVVETIYCNGETSYNKNRYAQLSSRVRGVIKEVNVDLGKAVQKKHVLAVIDSADFGLAKAELLRAKSRKKLWIEKYKAEKKLFESKVSSRQKFLEISTNYETSNIAYAKAAQELRNLGLSEDQIKKIEKAIDTSSLLPMYSPFKGVVVAQDAVIGEVVDTTKVLFNIADMTNMWGMLSIYESDN
ncbi:MAG: efflux RND transporter periplasmic adaptor subunit [Planctomycetota bacterium]